MKIRWVGDGVEEKGLDAAGHCVIAVDPRYFRPTEVDTLLGDASKAHTKLGWKPRVSFPDLVSEMVRADLTEAQCDELLKPRGRTVALGSRAVS